jgi:hypothetical protein
MALGLTSPSAVEFAATMKPAQEALHLCSLWVVKDLGWRPLFDHCPGFHEENLVGDVIGEMHLVRNADHRQATRLQPNDHFENLPHQFGVKRRRDFIEQQNMGRMARARAIATRCCCPPERNAG